jgi:hypothetical protein
LKPVDETYYVLGQMVAYCEVLEAPFLVLETPARYAMSMENVEETRDFLSSANLRGVRLVWEIRATVTPAVVDLMQDFNVVHSVDLCREEPSFKSDVVYGRLFGKGNFSPPNSAAFS